MQNSTKQQAKINTNFKRLSIQIDLGGLSFCVYNPAAGCIENILELPINHEASFELVGSELRLFLSSQGELRQDFDSIVALHNNPYFALVPTELFTHEQMSQYLKFNAYGQKADVISYEEIPQLQVVNSYLPFTDINAVIRETYGRFDYQHFASLWLKVIHKHNFTKQQSVYAHYQSGGFYVAMFSSSRELVFMNYFAYNHPPDMLYYLLFAMQQMSFSPNEVPLFLSGSIIRRSELFALLYKYVRRVFFLPFHGKPFCSGGEGALARRNFVLTHSF